MTNRELNHKIKMLWKRYQIVKTLPSSDYYKEIEEIGREYRLLYYADGNMKSWNLQSFRIMIVMNRVLNVIPHHFFCINLEP